MTNENEFFRELGNVPGLPPYLYGAIRRKIRRRVFRRWAGLALAATLVLTAGTAGYLATHEGANAALTPEVATELQSIRDYCNGEDLTTELEAYALYEGE